MIEICKSCKKEFKRKSYQQKFCCIKCKDWWHNNKNTKRKKESIDRLNEYHKKAKKDKDNLNVFSVYCSNESCLDLFIIKGKDVNDAKKRYGYKSESGKWYCCEKHADDYWDDDLLYSNSYDDFSDYYEGGGYGLGQE